MRNRSGYYRQRKQTRLILWVCACVRKHPTLAVLSAEVVAKRQPSGETWQERMVPWWASTSWSFSPLSVSHILQQATRTRRLFGICFEDAADWVKSVCILPWRCRRRTRTAASSRKVSWRAAWNIWLVPCDPAVFYTPPSATSIPTVGREGGTQQRNQSNFQLNDLSRVWVTLPEELHGTKHIFWRKWWCNHSPSTRDSELRCQQQANEQRQDLAIEMMHLSLI